MEIENEDVAYFISSPSPFIFFRTTTLNERLPDRSNCNMHQNHFDFLLRIIVLWHDRSPGASTYIHSESLPSWLYCYA